MSLDLFTVTVATAVVVIVAGVVFLLETLIQPASAAARIWSASFLTGILAIFSYLVWALGPDGAWVATAIGNAAFVLSIGFLWVGCRRFNDHPTRAAYAAVGAVAAAAAVAVLVAGPAGGDWAGAAVMFLGIAGFTVLGVVETRRGVMGRQSVALALTAVLAVAAAYYATRTVAFLAAGPDSTLFQTWFGTALTSILTIILSVTTVVVMSVLRAVEATLRGRGGTATLGVSGDGLFDPRSFEALLAGTTGRAEGTAERVAVIALRIDELPQIATAFGTAEAAELVRAWRAGVQEAAPLAAIVGEEGPYGVMVALPVASTSEARTVAGRLHQQVVDHVADAGAAVTPVVGVGVAVTDVSGYRAAALIDASNAAARQSAEGLDAAVVVAS